MHVVNYRSPGKIHQGHICGVWSALRMLRGLVWWSYAVVFELRCVLSFKMGFWVCGSGGVRDVHVIICTRVVQIGVSQGPGPIYVLIRLITRT